MATKTLFNRNDKQAIDDAKSMKRQQFITKYATSTTASETVLGKFFNTHNKEAQDTIARTDNATDVIVVSHYLDSEGDQNVSFKVKGSEVRGSFTNVGVGLADESTGAEQEVEVKGKKSKKESKTTDTTSKKLTAKIIEPMIAALGKNVTIHTITAEQKLKLKEKLTAEGYDMKYYSNQLSNIKIAKDKEKK